MPIDRDTVTRKASENARDAQSAFDLSDAERECLEDILRSDEAFGRLVTAQQAAVGVRPGDFRIDEETGEHATAAAGHLGTALDRVLSDRVEDAKHAVELAKAEGMDLPWLQGLILYEAGYRSVDDLRDATQDVLIQDAGIPPATAAKITAAVGSYRESESA